MQKVTCENEQAQACLCNTHIYEFPCLLHDCIMQVLNVSAIGWWGATPCQCQKSLVSLCTQNFNWFSIVRELMHFLGAVYLSVCLSMCLEPFSSQLGSLGRQWSSGYRHLAIKCSSLMVAALGCCDEEIGFETNRQAYLDHWYVTSHMCCSSVSCFTSTCAAGRVPMPMHCFLMNPFPPHLGSLDMCPTSVNIFDVSLGHWVCASRYSLLF